MEIRAIPDADDLYRRLHPQHVNRFGDVRSNAYKYNGRPQGEPSVDWSRLTSAQQSRDRARGSEWGLGVIVAKKPRALRPPVQHAPDPGDPAVDPPANPAHSSTSHPPDDPHGLALCDALALKTAVLIPPTQTS